MAGEPSDSKTEEIPSAPAVAAPEVKPSTADEARDEEDVKAPGEEEGTGAEIAPIVSLEAVKTSTGEENEEVLLDLKSKLYRFDRDGNQWKERGLGQVKLLEHKETGKIRLVMRQSRTLKICANHLVLPGTTLQPQLGSEKAWVWHASDYSDGELKQELFCMRFGSVEIAHKFKDGFEAAQEKAGKGDEDSSSKGDEADEAAEAVGNLSVADKAEEVAA